MVKFYVNGTVVPKDQENFVRPVRKNIVQAGTTEQQTLYERVSDHEILQTLLEFGGLD